MKALNLFVIAAALLASLSATAQSPIYLFEEYADGTVILKDHSVVKTQLNLDIFHDKFLYKEGDQVMEMTDLSNIAAVYIGERTFIPQGRFLYEVLRLDDENNLLVKWHQKKIPMGRKAGYDQIAHGQNTQALPTGYYSPSPTQTDESVVMRTVSENKYGILSQGSVRSFADRRSFLKLFPDHKMQIEAFIAENHVSFSRLEDVVSLTKYALDL